MSIDFAKILDPGEILVTMSTYGGVESPVSPVIGDYNLDGYPDIMISVKKNSQTHLVILKSVPCTATTCSRGKSQFIFSEAFQKERRTFVKLRQGISSLESIKNVVRASFSDVNNDVKFISF